MSLIVGLTGGIGSGKSTVAELFAAKGVPIVDTDLIAHELTGPWGKAMPALSAAFGELVVAEDGRLNRDEMRRLAFADASARSRLEAILHPMIRAESERRCAVAATYVLLVVPLLVETGGYRERVNRVLVVDCEESIQVARVMSRSALSADEVSAIMATQATRADRLAVADDVVVNNGARAELQAEVNRLHDRYRLISGH